MQKIKSCLFLFSAVFLLIFSLTACGNDEQEEKIVDSAKQEQTKIISAHTNGIISRTDRIRVLFNSDIVQENDTGKALEKSPFTFEPEIEGEAIWSNANTLEFIPSQQMAAASLYKVMLQTKQLVSGLSEEQQTFSFSFRTFKRDFQITLSELEYVDEGKLDTLEIAGSLNSSEKESKDDVERIITGEQEGSQLKIEWEHSLDQREHNFVIKNIQRLNKTSSALVRWDATNQQINFKGKKEFPIAPLGKFNILDVRLFDKDEQQIVVTFSDPLDNKQNLNGLLHIPDIAGSLKFLIEQNKIIIFPSSRLSGDLKLYIEPGIKNIFKKTIKKRLITDIQVKDIKPQIKLLGKGTIIPNSTRTIFPFEAVNLKAVDLVIKKISETNIHQFLQINNFQGDYQLNRVGETILRKRVLLDENGKLQLNDWNRHGIDLSELIKTEPGAIYQIMVGFRKSYSLYPCQGDIKEQGEEKELAYETEVDEASLWDFYEQYNNYQYYKRNDPCDKSYYLSKSHFKTHNVFSTDIGLIVKKATDKTLTIAVTDLITTNPIPQADLEIYNYQKRLLKTLKTGENGLATISVEGKPFLVIAKKEKQRGYLPLKDGLARNLSKFDVSGKANKKGLKGYLYGERGVWRPGDEMFLTFILADKEGKLPKEHPVSFELLNPKGQSVKHIVTRESVNGFYSFHVKTDEKALTGDYTAKVKAGGATFTSTLKVESILPNRLKISFDVGTEFITKGDKELKGKLAVTWLHGAIAKNLKTKINVVLNPTTTKFAKFSDYAFDDQGRHFRQEKFSLFDKKVNEKGEAEIPLNFSVSKNSPGMLSANFTARVFEPGGNFSSDRFSVPYHPYETYVGLKLPKGDKKRGMLLTDKDHTVEIATVNKMGEPVSREDITVSFYKLSWKWWWEQTSGTKPDYASKDLKAPLATGKINTKDGIGTWNLQVKYPDWGRYLVRACDKDGHCSGKIVYIDWPGYAGRDQGKQAGGGTTIIAFTSDKKSYQTGETVKLTIPTSENGRALITIETGSKVLQTHWIDTKKGETQFSFQADKTMLPNIYANVTLLQPHAQTANDLPIRLYGVLPLKIEDPDTHLAPKIAMNDVLRPEEDFVVRVSEENGRPMTYTIAIVDDGLLDLTRFKTPVPWKSFYAKEALSIKTWDYYDEVLGVYGDTLKTLLNIGGGDEISAPDASKVNRFKPVVKFLGPFTLDADATTEHIIEMPSYVGSVRTMVVAGDKNAYGTTEKTTPVRKPLMVIGTLPRVAGIEETINFPLAVFAMEDHIKEVNVELITNGLLQPVGETLKTITFSETGDQIVNFPLKVGAEIGTATVRAIVSSGDEISEYEIDLLVRNPNPPISTDTIGYIAPEKEWASKVKPFGIKGTNSGTLEISSIPPLNLAKRLDFLIRYPHGCIEQTTSAAFPQLYLNDLLELDNSRKEQIEQNINNALKRLTRFQLPSGGLSYWPGERDASEWASNYAGHFALETSKLGYLLPKNFLKNWLRHQREMANNWKKTDVQSELVQAYRLYLLALANQPLLGAMNRFRESKLEDIPSQWVLAATYFLVGQHELALEMTKGLSTDIEEYTELSNTYGSAVRDKAMILEAMVVMDLNDEIEALMLDISKSLNSDKWLNTQATAFSLLAMGKAVRANGGELNFNYRLDNGGWNVVNMKKPVKQVALNFQDAKAINLSVLNTNKTPLFTNLHLAGTPAINKEKNMSNNLSMTMLFYDMDNNVIEPTEIVQGTDFYVEVSVQNPSKDDYKEMALTQVFPSGWEIINSRMNNIKQEFIPTYQDIRDDRIMTYFDLEAKEIKTFKTYLNASYKGRFYLPGQFAEAMYSNNIKALKKGMWVEVVERKTKKKEPPKEEPKKEKEEEKKEIIDKNNNLTTASR